MIEVFGSMEDAKNIKIFDTSAEHKVAFSRQLKDDFHIVQEKVEMERGLIKAHSMTLEHVDFSTWDRTDVYLAELDQPLQTFLPDSSSLLTAQFMDPTLYLYQEQEDDGELFYVLKRSLKLPEKPYCTLQLEDEVYIGCDFNIAVYSDRLIKHVIPMEHRITHLFPVGGRHIVATGNWNLVLHVVDRVEKRVVQSVRNLGEGYPWQIGWINTEAKEVALTHFLKDSDANLFNHRMEIV